MCIRDSFEPILIRAMGFSPVAAQGLSALPHLFAFIVVLLVSYASDRLRVRSYPIIAVAGMAMCGYMLLALAGPLNLPHGLRYACLFPITAGFFSAVTLVIVWTMDNQQSKAGKGAGISLLNYIGQLGPFVGTSLYRDVDAPYYTLGHAICAGFMALVVALALLLRLVLRRENASAVAVAYARVGGQDEEPMIHDQARGQDRESFLYML